MERDNIKKSKITNEINTYDWDLIIFGGLCKNQLRKLSENLFGTNIFATLKKAEFIENGNILLNIELDNANIKLLNNSMGNNYAEKLSLNSDTHNFIFKSFEVIKTVEDLRDYEPTKISIKTLVNMAYVYAILEGFKKNK